jgi:hypothetical protein
VQRMGRKVQPRFIFDDGLPVAKRRRMIPCPRTVGSRASVRDSGTPGDRSFAYCGGARALDAENFWRLQ